MEEAYSRSERTEAAYAVARADGLPLFLAGLWETWKGPESDLLRTFTVMTTAPTPGSKMAELHHRVPLILSPDDVDV
jgi:putative SOS response-associated peptidase YedK